nr:MAG TPA: helix-turn-helix domain protein [Caudoviricetes sp.]
MGAQRLTDKQKKKIIADYVQLQNYTKTAKLNDVAESTVRKIVKNNPDCANQCDIKKEQNTQDMLSYMDSRKERVQEIIDVYLGALTDPEKLEGATLQQITTALGTLIDKWTKMDDIKRDSTASAKAFDFQTLADLLQHPAPDRNIKDFET